LPSPAERTHRARRAAATRWGHTDEAERAAADLAEARTEREAAEALAVLTRSAQGLPATIAAAEVLERVATALRSGVPDEVT
jgi:hypothetical protein